MHISAKAVSFSRYEKKKSLDYVYWNSLPACSIAIDTFKPVNHIYITLTNYVLKSDSNFLFISVQISGAPKIDS